MNTTADNAPSPTECSGAPKDCSLRQAIDKASPAGGDTVRVPPGVYTLSRGPLMLLKSVTIAGAGARTTTVSGDGKQQVFNMPPLYLPSLPTVTIADLAVTKGSSQFGGGIGVFTGTLKLLRVAVRGNTATAGATAGQGGGIDNDSTLVVNDSEISGNTAKNSASSGGQGGGIYNGPVGDLSVTNSTITANTAEGGTTPNETNGAGGGIFNTPVLPSGGGYFHLLNVTLAANVAGGPHSGGGNLHSAVAVGLVDGELEESTVENTIVAKGIAAVGANCLGFGVSHGHNLEDDAGGECGFTATGDQKGKDPKLGPLANNGGPTNTLALLAGSPAIDHADSACPNHDQRLVHRPQGKACDVGAFEAVQNADLALRKTATPASARTGQHVTYTLAVRNGGPFSAAGVKVTDSLPTGETLLSANASQGSCSGSKPVTCNLGSLAAGGHATVTILVRLDKSGTLVNTARVSSAAPDPNLANNRATAVVNTGHCHHQRRQPGQNATAGHRCVNNNTTNQLQG